MNFNEINQYYKENPPEYVIDDTGIRHQNEIPLPSKYEKEPCPCGIIHYVSDETWYHSYLIITQDEKFIKIVRKCKKCHEILMLKLINKN